MTVTTGGRIGSVVLALLLVGCGSAESGTDCDPGGAASAALAADPALVEPPAGLREVERVPVVSDDDSKTGDCNDASLFLDLEPGGADALGSYAAHLERSGWRVQGASAEAVVAERALEGGGTARVQVNLLADEGRLRVAASVPIDD